jgi:hypothetical protein
MFKMVSLVRTWNLDSFNCIMSIVSIPAPYMQSPFIGQMFEESPVHDECIVKQQSVLSSTGWVQGKSMLTNIVSRSFSSESCEESRIYV